MPLKVLKGIFVIKYISIIKIITIIWVLNKFQRKS